MNKRKRLKKWIKETLNIALQLIIATFISIIFFILIGLAILQTSYKYAPLTQAEINNSIKFVNK